jgi:MoaA/NifB/PqqE/SkfB family radical SAM enzyme
MESLKEWSKKNNFNSFNSMKGLLYSHWYQAIAQWKEGARNAPLPPIEVSLDPIHACNLMCEHCNAHRYLAESDKISEEVRMDDQHLLRLVKFLGEWGVKAICFGGGGEPTLHTRLGDALELSKSLGVHNSIATNGTAFTDKLVKQSVETCRWIGVSVDACNSRTYEIGRKANKFDKTVENIEKLVAEVKRTGAKCDVAFKFLIFSYNQAEIYDACVLAKKLGVKDFHARPADFRHQGLGEWQKKNGGYDLIAIQEQMERCHELESEDFRVFTVTHKFNDDFSPRRDFTGCYASPICIQLCANGKVYLCPDTRHMEHFELGEHSPDPWNILKLWGSTKHYDLVFSAESMKKCGSRCTFSPYNLQCEKLFIKDEDPFCWRFV